MEGKKDLQKDLVVERLYSVKKSRIYFEWKVLKELLTIL